MITTIDDNGALEAYIQVPLDRSPELRVGLPVQLLDAEGKVVATNPITFVAPRVDDATQTVLVKSALQGRAAGAARRSSSCARASSGAPPRADGAGHRRHAASAASTSASSPNSRARGLVARQRPVQVGELVGNDYVVTGGLKAGRQGDRRPASRRSATARPVKAASK